MFRRRFADLPLVRKILLIPALTALLTAAMLAVAVDGASRNTEALQALDRDVFEPLNAANDLAQGLGLTHAGLSALLLKGVIEADNRAGWDAAAAAVGPMIQAQATVAERLREALRGKVAPDLGTDLDRDLAAYLAEAGATFRMAGADVAFGAILMLKADGHFAQLRQSMDALVQSLSERRTALAAAAVADSAASRRLLAGLAVGSALLALLGSGLLGRAITRPLTRLTEVAGRLARGDTAAEVPGTDRRDEVGALARAVASAKQAAAALLRREAELSETNQRFDTALDNMLQGLCMFDADARLAVANRQLRQMLNLPEDGLRPGLALPALVGLVEAGGMLPRDLAGLVLARQKAGSPGSATHELANGRTIVASHRAMPSGGWVTTIEDITERREAEACITHMAHHDALTDLPNRVLFRIRLEAALARARRGEGCAVLCLDLDRFKEVNDTLGHPVGDALLKAVTARLQAELRETDTLARLGGDEFAIVQSDVGQPGDATVLARRLVEAIARPFDLDGQHVAVGTSIGIALSPSDGTDPDGLLKASDMALYRAKADGRGRWSFFEREMDQRMQARRLLEMDLRRALAVGEFELFYQPIMDVRSRQVTGMEALIRWRHPERGLVPPDAFIPLAEEIGLIVPIGEWVLRLACAEAAGWPGALRVAVNVSPTQFSKRGLVAAVEAALVSSGLQPGRLEIEITEAVMLQDTDTTLATLHRLKALGVRIAMDDFGTGYSSLSYLQRFPFDKVKIDRSFTRGLTLSRQSDAIVQAVTDLCSGLDITTTAEGVETTEQFVRLGSKGCTEAQGYLFSRPIPAGEIPALLTRLAMAAETEVA